MILYLDVTAAGEQIMMSKLSEPHLKNPIVKIVWIHMIYAIANRHDGGSIILNASIDASKRVGTTSIYSATKAAIRSFARTVDLKHRKIRVK